MGLFSRTSLAEHEAPIAQRMFDSIVEAERDTLTEEQRTNPRAYLLDVWERTAEAVMRPIQTREQLEAENRDLRSQLHRLQPNDDWTR